MGKLSCESGNLHASWRKHRIQELADSLDEDTLDAEQSEDERRDLKHPQFRRQVRLLGGVYIALVGKEII